MRRSLPTTLLLALALALAPAAAANPQAQTAAEHQAQEVLEQVEELREGEGIETGRELSHTLRELAVAVRHLRGEDRARAKEILARPTDSPTEDPDAFDPSLPVTTACDVNFCVHFVTSSADAADPAWAAVTLAEAEAVYNFHVGALRWRRPPSDGDGRTDIYLKELGSEGLFGYAATDPGQGLSKSQHSYLVIDNDFDPDIYKAPALESLRLTLAHEYAHVLQYGYDVFADGWHYEASATWFEHRMYPAIKDWHRFLHDTTAGSGWRSLTDVPLTAFEHPADEKRNAKPYGSAVWNHFLSSRYAPRGDELQRLTWERSDGWNEPSTSAHNHAILAVGGSGLAREFASFAAAVAEWRVPSVGFPDASLLPDMARVGTLAADGPLASRRMDHLTFALYEVPPTQAARIRLSGAFPEGTRGALALVGRNGAAGGPVKVETVELPTGGSSSVSLAEPGSFTAGGGRITAVVVNADASHGPYNMNIRDWTWHRDAQPVAARVTGDGWRPAVTSRAPAPGARRVRPRARIRVAFSTAVTGVSAKSFSLRHPNGRRVPATVSHEPGSQTAVLTPRSALTDTTRYAVRLTRAIEDPTGIALAPIRWRFTTVRQKPRARLARPSLTASAASFQLRSRDRDRLRWTATLRANGRAVARRQGRLRAGSRRTVRLRSPGARQARLAVALTDPQGNRKRLTRRLRLGR